MRSLYKNNNSLLAGLVISILAITACSDKKVVEETKPEVATPVPVPAPEPKVVPLAWVEFAEIQPGKFVMGCDKKVDKCHDDELPMHNVELTNSFSVSKHEITQKAWQEIMGNNPSTFVGESNPVESVSFNDVQQFISKLNGLAGDDIFRLPTEAEWEYLARAGQSANYPLATKEQLLADSAWFGQLETTGTQAVGQLKPNAWGVYDISGNVTEWVQDCWKDNYEKDLPGTAAPSSVSCDSHVLRGGSWIDTAAFVRLAYRNNWDQDYRSHEAGFRLVKIIADNADKQAL